MAAPGYTFQLRVVVTAKGRAAELSWVSSSIAHLRDAGTLDTLAVVPRAKVRPSATLLLRTRTLVVAPGTRVFVVLLLLLGARVFVATPPVVWRR